jgi:hypothetical protein
VGQASCLPVSVPFIRKLEACATSFWPLLDTFQLFLIFLFQCWSARELFCALSDEDEYQRMEPKRFNRSACRLPASARPLVTRIQQTTSKSQA